MTHYAGDGRARTGLGGARARGVWVLGDLPREALSRSASSPPGPDPCAASPRCDPHFPEVEIGWGAPSTAATAGQAEKTVGWSEASKFCSAATTPTPCHMPLTFFSLQTSCQVFVERTSRSSHRCECVCVYEYVRVSMYVRFSVPVCVRVCVHVSVCISVICVCLCMYVCASVCACVCVLVPVSVCMRVDVCLCMCISVCLCVYECMHVSVCMSVI